MKKEHLCMAKERVRESITSLKIRVGDPPKLPASCPVCNCPFGSKEEGLMRVARCARCGVKHHEPCFWRVLPLEDWVEYVQRSVETNEEDEEEDGFEIICALCLEKGEV